MSAACGPSPAGGDESQAERRCGALSGLVEHSQFVGEFGIDLLGVVEVCLKRVDFEDEDE